MNTRNNVSSAPARITPAVVRVLEWHRARVASTHAAMADDTSEAPTREGAPIQALDALAGATAPALL